MAALGAFPHADPCVLIGFSFGGLVAFEAAHQLRRQGKEVQMVVILDSTIVREPSPLDGLRTLLGIPGRTARHLLARGARWASRTPFQPRTPSRPDVPAPVGKATRFDERGEAIPGDCLMWSYDCMRQRYRPEPLDGRGVFFQARELPRLGLTGVEPRAGWKGLFTRGLKVVVVPGDHLSMVRDERHVAVLGKHMQALLA